MKFRLFDFLRCRLEEGVVPSTQLDLVPFKNKLVLANTGPVNELSTLTSHAMALIDEYAQTPDSCERLAVLGHIYFTVNTGLGMVAQTQAPGGHVRVRSNAMHPSAPRTVQGVNLTQVHRGADRRQVLEDLFRAVAARLAASFNTTVNVLPRYLEDRFGSEMNDPKAAEDFEKLFGEPDPFARRPRLTYLDAMDRARYKVVFRNGRAFSLINALGAPAVEGPLDTTQSGSWRGNHRLGAWGFVVSMSRELYVMNHSHGANVEGADRFFHSSYLSGSNVLTAGDCVFRDGHLESITNLSGHYTPTPVSLLHAIDLFRARGVDLSKVLVGGTEGEYGLGDWNQPEDFEESALSVQAFIAHMTDWQHLKTQRPRRLAVNQVQRRAREG